MRSFTLILAASALTLGACATTVEGPPPVNSLASYSLQVEPGIDRIALAVHENGLSPTQRAALGDLAGRYSSAGAPWLRVEAPAGDDPAATAQAYAVRDALQNLGVPGERIMVVGYAAPDPRAPVLAGFETLRPVIPNCALEPRAMEGGFSNRSAPGFGCAVTANMAAQIANPRDILGQRQMTPAETGRSAVVFAKYRSGETTSATQEPLIEGRVAQAVE
ncbi:CpaD family pilus assembly protein [Brevundimonas sp. NPDC092305]|uniref:CpaD family pilus assembly protein n=1 Tax=Brevundimonas sp. NPDC092305 TaxID=3363957 RepID=UPI0038215DA0